MDMIWRYNEIQTVYSLLLMLVTDCMITCLPREKCNASLEELPQSVGF